MVGNKADGGEDDNNLSQDTNEEDANYSVAIEDGEGDDIASREEDGIASSQSKKVEVAVGRGKKKSMGACPRPMKVRRLVDLPTVQVMTSSSKEATTPVLNKGKAVMTSSSKKVATPTSKFMGSSFKASASSKTMVMVTSSKAVQDLQSKSTSSSPNVSVRTSASANIEQSTEVEDEANLKIGRKLTSFVWDYFTKFVKEVIKDDGSVIKEQWAKCKMCPYTTRADNRNGRHAFSKHLKLKHKVVKGQQLLHQKDDSIATYQYDQEASLRKFYYAIIMHEYPFNISQHEYFVDFIKSLRPSFPVKSRNTIRKEIMDLYKEEKSKLYDQFKSLSCRFSFTMDMWTSNQNKAYICVTAYWVDDNWNMQKRIINFIHVHGNHSGLKLGDTFFSNVLNWNLDKKMFALSLDNASSNKIAADVVIENARGLLVCGGKFFHVRCANHILNLVVTNGLQTIGEIIGNIREFITIVKRSPHQWEAFEKCAKECDLDTKKALSLDVVTRWNSTYIMIRDAIYYKDVFDRLALKDRARYGHVNPTSHDWLNAANICKCLKKFYNVTLLFSGTSYPTANHFYRKFCEIKIAIARWYENDDVIISTLAESMKDKFEKYWDMSNLALAVAAFLDPRYKHKLVELYLSKIYSTEMAELEKVKFMNVVNELFAFYSSSINASSINKTSASKECDMVSKSRNFLLDDKDENEVDIDVLYHSTSNDKKMSELDVYMSEGLLKFSDGDGEFDVLSWWKGQMATFPILSCVARDVLSMQVSTVASESAFSADGRVIDPFRSRLDADIVEALVCTKDWMIVSQKDLKNKIATLIEDLNAMGTNDDIET